MNLHLTALNYFTVTCESCSQTSTTFTHFYMLPIDVGLGNVEGGLANLFQDETVEGFKCNKCQVSGRAVKSTKLEKNPLVLIVQVRRFVDQLYESAYNIACRRETVVFIPYCRISDADHNLESGNIQPCTTLNLKNYLHTNSLAQGKKLLYKLFGQVSHIGDSDDHGHYVSTAYFKRKYYKFDDAQVRASNQCKLSNKIKIVSY